MMAAGVCDIVSARQSNHLLSTRMNKCHIFAPILLMIVLFVSLVSSEVRAKAYLTPGHCALFEYFDVLSLTCVPCTTWAQINFSLAPNQTEVLESVESDKTVCQCRSGLVLDQLGSKYRCVNRSCAAGQVVIAGECGTCEAAGPNCQCQKGAVLRKIYVQNEVTNQSSVRFRCVSFQAGMQSITEAPCHPSYLLASQQSCQCPQESFVEEDGQCVPQRVLISVDIRLQYSNIRFRSDRFVSQHLYNTIRPAVYNCNNLKNQSACHHLLNVCALKLATELSSGESGEEKWNLCLYLSHLNPKLEFQVDSYYVSDHQESVIKDQFHANDIVQMVAIVYGNNGRFLKMTTLPLGDLFLCDDAKLKHTHIDFGTNLYKSCTWSASDLWRFALLPENNQFWEIFLVSGTSRLYPVPVRVSFGHETATRWMIKRFFLVNSQVGVDLTRFNQDGTKRFILYARSLSLQFQISKYSVDGQIYPPIISIEYAAIEANTNRANHSLETEFSVVFKMNDSNTKYNLNLVVSILTSLAILWSIFRTWCWMKRSAKGLDLSVAGTFVAKTVTSMSTILLLVSLFFVINQLVVFKFQTVIHTVLLTPTQESTIVVYLVVAYVIKLFSLFRHILTVTSIDIFFIDWEKPRKKELLLDSYANKLEDKTRDRFVNSDKRLEADMANHRRPSAISNLSMADPSSNITIWRSYFVANEWCELSVKRRINISLHIFMLIFALECTGWKTLAKASPHASDPTNLEEVPESSTARLALASILYIVLASIQYLFKKYLWENLGSGKLNEFMDLCSVSNISVFCLKYKRYGYYLHGLSPNGRSDVNMLEMYDLLEMEESDLCSKRGLMPNTEQQTFEMFLPAVVHDHWKGLRKSFDRSTPMPFIARLGSNWRDIDKGKLVHTYFSINRFLCSFIEHSFAKADYIVQERSGIESLFNFELGSMHQKGRFYNDNGHSFENVLFYGIELTVATFELMTFLMIDLIFRNYILAAIMTYFVSKLITRVYAKLSRKNLVHKTLMDDRFLI